jgi:hypothetical protein
VRRLAAAAAAIALVATPALANAEAIITTPDGVEHVCEVDSPGASFEANLIRLGYTDRFSIVNGADLNLLLLCQPGPASQ